LAQERSTLASFAADLERQRILRKQQILQGEEDLALLEVELQAARRALDRAERIRAEGLINAVEYEKAQDDVTVGAMKLEAAQQRSRFELETLAFEVRDRESRCERQRLVVAEVERQIADLTLRAPFAGLVSRVEVVDRDSVAEGQALVTIVDLSALDIEIAVPEAYADELVPGRPADSAAANGTAAGGTRAEITYGGRVFPARLKQVAPEVAGSRVRAVLAFEGPVPAGLRQNQRVSTRLILETRPDVLKVARGPFLEAGGGNIAYVVADGVARQRQIRIGSLSVSEIEILSGLDVGDEIIVSDTSRFITVQTILLRP
jgi:HlyD family secretion protein